MISNQFPTLAFVFSSVLFGFSLSKDFCKEFATNGYKIDYGFNSSTNYFFVIATDFWELEFPADYEQGRLKQKESVGTDITADTYHMAIEFHDNRGDEVNSSHPIIGLMKKRSKKSDFIDWFSYDSSTKKMAKVDKMKREVIVIKDQFEPKVGIRIPLPMQRHVVLLGNRPNGSRELVRYVWDNPNNLWREDEGTTVFDKFKKIFEESIKNDFQIISVFGLPNQNLLVFGVKSKNQIHFCKIVDPMDKQECQNMQLFHDCSQKSTDNVMPKSTVTSTGSKGGIKQYFKDNLLLSVGIVSVVIAVLVMTMCGLICCVVRKKSSKKSEIEGIQYSTLSVAFNPHN